MKTIITALRIVFRKPRYIVGAGLTAGAVFTVAAILPNMRLVLDVFESRIPLETKVVFLTSIVGSMSAISGSLSATLTLIIAALFGVTMAMTAYHLKRNIRGRASTTVGLSFGALVSSTFGIGCAACGSLVGSALLPFVGATGALALLPLGGAEFSIVGIALLLLSIALISRKITAPLACEQ
ncbi:hypothetical protein A3C91_01385 [Candidatus Azambacteria bacterium RIFCSPHIGHO2_02_FULL_52_12]|uniref:Uncharacterized protein n=1 Tax=Candidatus Azambacteria bacterium RIFCSPLOWO2_01_FULL_46_25 TaxID=1797298 RepID=A0A1F5BVC2_9BACT|nr:MAG: hypothetical protein A3C91_01385 [Candidatus Azambacteria bacterium RIFCSPHIGHO2_02_FULL_52_12]OGD34541.1 MAG: hypothetical protein A2988_03445 [Candidatus Azambacteria bacterium RIFCSPLOWO2_01_FULL_46_25]OGD36415.1 MAG: hypothetical protein A2850_01945 [Candidatus Azambacteria bacterium RIFCSPHIGHO2_01_FULL_51_74]